LLTAVGDHFVAVDCSVHAKATNKAGSGLSGARTARIPRTLPSVLLGGKVDSDRGAELEERNA
jgi:hypothetical protein